MKKIITGLLVLVVCLISCKKSEEAKNGPTINFQANPIEININESSTLTWNILNSEHSEMRINNSSLTTINSSGSMNVILKDTTTYTIFATNQYERVDKSVTVTVKKSLPIIDNFSADKTTLKPNETTTLRWNVSNAQQVVITRNGNSEIGKVSSIGTRVINPTQYGESYNIYKLTASNIDGEIYKEIQIVVSFPDVEYRVSGSTSSVSITYANKDEGTSQVDASTPWSYSWSGAISGQFLYVSAQNQRSRGSVKVEIYKNGSLYKVSESSGAYVIATASGTY